MAKTDQNVYIAKTNFTGGQWSPELAGRVDLPQYANAVLEMTNFLPVVRGGARVSPGSFFVARCKYYDTNTVLIGFEFNEEQAYICEFGNEYVRFYANEARLENEQKTITGVSDNAGTIRVTSAAHGFSNGQFVAIRNVIGVSASNGDWEISGVTTDTFDLVGSVFSGSYTSGGTANHIIEIASPYIAEDLYELKTTQSADTMYIFHPDYPTYKLARTSATTFTLEEVDWEITPFLPVNVSNTTIDPNGTAVNSTIDMVANAAVFTADHVGTYFRIANGVVKVTTVTNSTSAQAVVKKTVVDAATADWSEGAWGDESGYPRAGVFYENRLVVGGTREEPQTIWGSKSAPEYENFDMSNTADAFAYQYELASRQANIIRWLVGDDLLLVGTSGREFKVTGGNDSGITPTNVFARPQSRHGSKDIEPVETTSGVVFVQRSGRKTRLMAFNLDKDKYVAPDLTILSNRIASDGVLQVTYEAEPNEVVWHVLSDGSLGSLTLLSEQNVMAWAKRTTQGLYKSAKSISTLTDDQTWTVVERTVNGETVRYVEYFSQNIAVDCAVQTVFNSAVTTITSGMDHLEGETVVIIGDDAVYPTQEVTNGALPTAFDTDTTNVLVGLELPTPTIELFTPDRELAEGHTLGRNLRVVNVSLLVDESRGFSINGEINPVRSTSDLTDIAVEPETEILKFNPDLDWNEHVIITQHLPYPGHILAAAMYVEIGE